MPFVVIGLVSGSVYGLAAVGLVLTYKTSGIFNFAHGAVAALAVYIFYYLYVDLGLPWGLCAALCIGVLGPLMGLALERLAALLADSSDTQKIASTIGIILLVIGVGQLWYPTAPNMPSFLPTGTVRFLGANVGHDQLIIFAVALIATGVLYYYFRYVRMGMAMRAVVDDSSLVGLTGENPDAVRRWAWIIGAVFASASGNPPGAEPFGQWDGADPARRAGFWRRGRGVLFEPAPNVCGWLVDRRHRCRFHQVGCAGTCSWGASLPRCRSSSCSLS